jgi:peptidoglycan/xylan/chitin deacetylase (PgdA/CDA1 family)
MQQSRARRHSPARRPRGAVLAGLAGLAAVALVISACSGSIGGDGPAGASGATPDASGGARRDPVDPASITGLHVISDGSESGPCRYAARYPAIPGADALTATLGRAVREDVARLTGDDGIGCSGARADLPELNLDFEIVVASGDVAAVRLTRRDYTAAGSGLSTHTYWYDGATRTSPDNAGLFAGDDALARLAALLEQRLAGREGADRALLDDVLATPRSTASALTDVTFTGTGDLALDFDRGAVAVPPAGAQHVVIPAAEAAPLLSDLGRRAQRQSTDPAPALDLGVTATADPTPTTTPRPSDVDCRRVKCVALTFDDGPGPDTGRLLETLAAHDAHATFFVVGRNVRTYRSLTRAELAAGHELGNHTWNHADLTRRPDAEIRSQLSRTDDAVTAATGTAPTVMRPPYGALNTAVRRQIAQPIILWSVDTEDWKNRDSTGVADYTLKTVRPGDIVLFHDIHATTVAAVPRILETLAARGYHFVTVTQLYGDQRLRPGAVYHANEDAYGR